MTRTSITALLAAGLAFTGCGFERPADTAAPPASSKTTSTVDSGSTHITYKGRDGATALELLRDSGYKVQTEKSPVGEYVTAIGDVEATKSTYWLYYVDGKQPPMGADKYETRDGQRIEWRFTS